MDEAPQPASVRDLVLLWAPGAPSSAYAALAADLGGDYREHMPRDWARRGRIPAEHIDPVVTAAQRRGFTQVTHELVLRLVTAGVAA